MPKPRDGENKKSYISRFMGSPEAVADFPDEKQRLAVAYSMFEKRNASFSLTQPKEIPWPRKYEANYIEPGVVAYQDLGPCKTCGNAFSCGNEGDACQPEGATVLVKQEALERMSKSFIGKPVIDVEHEDVTPSTVLDGEADGIVTGVRLDPKTGWWYCDFLVWNPVTQQHCEDGVYSVSCAYNPTKTSEQAGEWHNVPYAEEILDGELTHLAIVKNPRYEGARITLVNSKGGSMWKWFKKGERKNAASLDPLKTKVNVDGQDVALKDLYEAAKEEVPMLNDDTILEVEGKEKTLGELKQAYRNKMKQNADKACPTCGAEKVNAEPKEDTPGEQHPLPDLRTPKNEGESAEAVKKNTEEAEAKKALEEKKNADEAVKKEEEKKNAADAEAKTAEAKAAEEKKNAEKKADEELKAAADKAEKELANSKREAGRRAFADLRNARSEHVGEMSKINPVSIDDRLARGKNKYGSPA